MSSRKNQKQIWADERFIQKLENIRAKRVLAGKPPIKNIGELTKIISETETFRKLEEEVINWNPLDRKSNKMRINIRFDGGLL